MMTLEEFRLAMEDELGDAVELVRDENLDRWVNRGRVRLGIFEAKVVPITWLDTADSVPLPDDFGRFDRVVSDPGTRLPQHVLVSGAIRFLEPACVVAGTATLYYGASYAAVDAVTPSTMLPLADEAAVSYALSRFFRRIAATRSDFRRYATVTGQSGIDVTDLTALADEHLREFEDVRAELLGNDPATFYSD